jgi:potassium efflux system protein
MELGAVRAELRRRESARDLPTTGEEEITSEEIEALRRSVAEAKDTAEAAEKAWEALRDRLAATPEEEKALEKLETELRGRRQEVSATDPLGSYRRDTLEIRLRRVREARRLLETGRDRGKPLLELLDVKRKLAALRLQREAERLARTEARLADLLAGRLARAREELARLQAASPPADEDAIRRARLRVDVLVARVRAEEVDRQRQELLAWKTREEGAEARLAERFARLQERFADVGGVSARTPELLISNLRYVREALDRIERQHLPSLKERLRERIGQRAEIQDRLLDVGDSPAATATVESQDDIEAALQAYHDQLNSDVQILLEIDGLYARRMATLADMESFLLGHMYWVRSDEPLGAGTVTGILVELRRIAGAWSETMGRERVRVQASGEPWRFVLLAIGFLVLVVGGTLLHRKLSAYRTRWRYRGGTLAVIVQRLLATAVLSSLAPLVLYLASWLLLLLGLPSIIAEPVRSILVGLAVVLFVRRFLGSSLREDGVFVAEFRVPRTVAEQLRSAGRFATTGLLLVALPWHVLRSFPISPPLNHLPRVLYLVLQAWLALVLVRLLRRRGALLQEATGGRRFWSRVASVLSPLLILATAFVLVMDALGYRFGARLIARNIGQTFLAGLILAGAYNLLKSLLDQAARRMRYDLRTEVGAQEARNVTETLAEQVSRFVGVATIALTVLLLTRFWDFGGSIHDLLASLRITVVDAEKDLWLTGWDLLRSLAWVAGGHFVTANLAGLLHVLVFARLPSLQTGSRFAIVSIVRYVVLLVSYAAAILSLHLSFSSIGWALAAVSLGVGFGLQEIVANFVSGLILLFERPVRVGDVVTVGTTTGTVDRINIRATQILNWDRQVIIIPNRRFISEEVVNWTHNDPVVRSTIDVGVAYGTDVVKARSVLFEIVTNHPDVKSDPLPRVWFWAFGDSSLTLRTFVFTSFELRIATVNALNLEIHRRFAQEGIEIAFPQRDLHLRSVPDPTSPLPAVPEETPPSPPPIPGSGGEEAS